MDFIFYIILQFLGELLVQILFQALAELGFYSLANTFKKPRHPVLSTIGFFLWGAIAGGVSLWIAPASFIINLNLKQLNLIVTPVIIGGAMMFVGKLREKKGQQPVQLDHFGYAFVFAFGMALVRFIWAK